MRRGHPAVFSQPTAFWKPEARPPGAVETLISVFLFIFMLINLEAQSILSRQGLLLLLCHRTFPPALVSNHREGGGGCGGCFCLLRRLCQAARKATPTSGTLSDENREETFCGCESQRRHCNTVIVPPFDHRMVNETAEDLLSLSDRKIPPQRFYQKHFQARRNT